MNGDILPEATSLREDKRPEQSVGPFRIYILLILFTVVRSCATHLSGASHIYDLRLFTRLVGAAVMGSSGQWWRG